MKDFHLASRMLTLRGEFYPTGFVFVMLPSEADAAALEQGLLAAGFADEDMMLLSPKVILEEIAPTAQGHGDGMPSIGTESATVNKYRDLALQGHCAMMIRAGDADKTEAVMTVVRRGPFSSAEKYRFLAIEDLQ
jgi:hypothetical protein